MKKNIIILGAGFGGITAALTIVRLIGKERNEYDIILVDRHHHQLYTPALYEIASIPRQRATETAIKSSILIPVTDITAELPITFLCDEFTGLDAAEKKIFLTGKKELSYAFLILALGSETNYFNIPGLQEYSFPLKTCDDALRLRNAIEDLTRRGDRAEIVVGGGGSSGVEVAAEFINFFCAIQEDAGRHKNMCAAHLTIMEAAPDILPGFEPWIVAQAKKRLVYLGIAVRTGMRVQTVNEKEITNADGGKQPYDILVWTGGVKGPTIFAGVGLPLSDKGSLVADEYLRVAGGDNSIFAIGDNAAVKNLATGRMLVWNAPAAQAEARVAAYNIFAAIRGQRPRPFVPKKKYPFVLAMGRKYAVTDLGWLHSAGMLGWCIKQLAELRYLLFILPWQKAIRIWRLDISVYTSND